MKYKITITYKDYDWAKNSYGHEQTVYFESDNRRAISDYFMDNNDRLLVKGLRVTK